VPCFLPEPVPSGLPPFVLVLFFLRLLNHIDDGALCTSPWRQSALGGEINLASPVARLIPRGGCNLPSGEAPRASGWSTRCITRCRSLGSLGLLIRSASVACLIAEGAARLGLNPIAGNDLVLYLCRASCELSVPVGYVIVSDLEGKLLSLLGVQADSVRRKEVPLLSMRANKKPLRQQGF
jgi:hypothetical protein